MINSEITSFWRNDEKLMELKLKNSDASVQPISVNTLISYLTDNNRNYLKLGANAFTKLMMETMRL
ncbi:MAG: hypothetical protein HC819_08635 [Cyclobacteriaceae bacterium]|nr:hypothetical protein [Cyclobacteriaceae bacterium]